MHPRFLYDLDDCAILGAYRDGGRWLDAGRSSAEADLAAYGAARRPFAKALGCGRGDARRLASKPSTAGLLVRQAGAEPGQRPLDGEYYLTDMQAGTRR